MIDLKTFADLSSQPVGEFSPKPTTVTPGQKEASSPLWTSADGLTHIGVWECTPGVFTADRTKSAEYCHIISGTYPYSEAVCNQRGGISSSSA